MKKGEKERSAKLTRLKLLRLQRGMLETRRSDISSLIVGPRAAARSIGLVSKKEKVKKQNSARSKQKVAEKGTQGREIWRRAGLGSRETQDTAGTQSTTWTLLDNQINQRSFDGSRQIKASELNDYLRVTPAKLKQISEKQIEKDTKENKFAGGYSRLYQQLLKRTLKNLRYFLRP
jgi:hypothetical protein